MYRNVEFTVSASEESNDALAPSIERGRWIYTSLFCSESIAG